MKLAGRLRLCSAISGDSCCGYENTGCFTSGLAVFKKGLFELKERSLRHTSVSDSVR